MGEKTNILFLHHVSCLAGAERNLLSLWAVLSLQYKPYFICQEPGPLTQEAIKLGVSVHFMQMRAWRKFKNWLANLRTIGQMAEFCRANDIQVIVSNYYRLTPFAVKVARRLNIPCVTMIQDFVPENKIKCFLGFKSDMLIGVSESICERITGNYQKPVECIHNGLDLDAFSDLVKRPRILYEEFKIPEGSQIVGMIAHLIALKGHSVFLRSMGILSKRFPDAYFVVVGEALDASKLSIDDLRKEAESFGIASRVIFTGRREDIPDILSCCHVVVQPSFREAFGRVVMEAMALGVAVVATDCGGPAEIIEDGKSGYIVKKGDEKAISDIVGRLLEDEKLRQEIGVNARERVRTNFSLDKTVCKINNVIQQLLEKNEVSK